MMRLNVARAACAALLAGALAGCGGGANIATPTPLNHLADVRVQPTLLWSSDGGDGAQAETNGLHIAIQGHNAYVANYAGDVAAFAIDSGEQLWRRDVQARLLSGPTVAGDTLLVTTRDGHLLALSLDDGHTLWQAAVSSEVVAPPAAYNGVAVLHTLDGRVVAYRLDNGDRLWTLERSVPKLTLRGGATPLIADGRVYAGLDNGEVLALDLGNGRLLWKQTVARPTGSTDLERLVDIDADMAIADNTLYVASIGDELAALSLNSGRILWRQDVASVTGVALSPRLVYTTDPDGVVHAVNRTTGAEVWTQDALKYRQLSAPVMYNGYVVVGDYDGYLHWLDPQTGQIVGRIDVLDTAIRATPVVVGDRILVLGTGGELVAVRG